MSAGPGNIFRGGAARVIRRNGDEYHVKVTNHRDLKMILANEDPDFEVMLDPDGGKFVVVYDATATRPNRVATELLPALAQEHNGAVPGDVVILEQSHFDELGGDDD